jgi:peptidoglycan/LPS O-acetylase OafA/YrhL
MPVESLMSKAVETRTVRPAQMHALTSLRFFAALYVVFFHVLPRSQQTSPAILHLLNLGFVSVSFFFLLSGYILATVYLPRDVKVAKRRFYVARFSRVYPLFFLTLLADTPILLHKRIVLYGVESALVKTAATVVGHLFLLQAWSAKLQFAINEPSWSLSVEAVLYLCFPFLGRVLWRLQGRALWIFTIALYGAGQFFVWILTPHLPLSQVKFNPLFHLSTFLLGVLLARGQRTADPSKLRQMPHKGFLYGALALSALAFWLLVQYMPVFLYTNIHDGLLAPLFAALIWVLSYPQFCVSRWLSKRWLVVLGESSFGLYLIHIVVLHWYGRADERLSMTGFATYLLLCIGLSLLLFYIFEAPARKWLIAAFHSSTPETLEAASDA